MAKRRTLASVERMRLISQLARNEKKDDDFGVRDEDWDVYKAINKVLLLFIHKRNEKDMFPGLVWEIFTLFFLSLSLLLYSSSHRKEGIQTVKVRLRNYLSWKES